MSNAFDGRSTAPSSESTALQALAVVARRLGVDVSDAELRRNYAMGEGEPKTKILLAIARDLGIEAKVIYVKFKDLARLGNSLPAIIRVSNGAALVLEGARHDAKVGHVAILRDPTVSEDLLTAVDETKLSKIWKGEVILLKRKFTTTDEEQPFSGGWLLGQVLRERRLFLDIGMAAVVSTIFALTPPFVFRIVSDRILANHSWSTLTVLVWALALLILFETVLGYYRRRLIEVATTRIDARLSLYLLEKLLKLPISFFESNPTGQIMSKVGRMWQIRRFMTGQLFGTLLDAVPLLGLVPVMAFINWRLTVLVLVLSFFIFCIVFVFSKPLARQYRKVVQAEQRRGAHLVETIYGMRTIKALAIEGRRRREWDERVAETTQENYAMGILSNYPHTYSLPLERLMFSGSICVGAYFALTMPNQSIGQLGMYAMLAMRMGQPLIQLARLQFDIAEARGAIGQLAEVVNVTPEDAREHSGMRPEMRGEFSFQDVSFRYSREAPYALDRINFTVPAGSTLGIMGRSGSGKSTITKLLQRLHTDYEGLIKVDGFDLREINLHHLRANLGVVLPENFLFSGTIRDNIAIARPDATLQQIVRAAQLAGAEEFIERMPRGYETRLEEGAVNLSSGQRQRLAIARALLTDPAALILDEATSALDAESEAIINSNLRRMAQGRTVITISHRLSMLVDCDAILVMERGKLYDIGTHDELLARCDIYKQLWHQQNRHVERGGEKIKPALAIGKV